MKKNLDYFDYCIHNVDSNSIINFSDPEGVLVISENPLVSQTEAMKANNELTKLISAYSVLKEKNESENVINKIVLDIINLLDNGKNNNINYTPFCVYFQVLHFSYASYCDKVKSKTQNEKIDFIKDVLDMYIEHRHNMYLNHGYSNTVLQVMSDSSSSRRKGKTGIELLENFLVSHGAERAKNLWDLDFFDISYLEPDKGDLKVFDEFLRNNKINFNFRQTRQRKNPDMLLKIGDEIFIIEHKLATNEGGSQNAEINEIISFINATENNPKVHYVACLQSTYVENFAWAKKNKFTNNENKYISQYKDILKYLEQYQENYFTNGRALEKLILDYVDEYNKKNSAK